VERDKRSLGSQEYEGEAQVKVIEKFRQIATGNEITNRFAKLIFGSFNFSGETKGFSVYETDYLEKLKKFCAELFAWKFGEYPVWKRDGKRNGVLDDRKRALLGRFLCEIS